MTHSSTSNCTTPSFEPDALRVARFRRGLKKSSVAERTGIAARRYGLIESGKDVPTESEVALLADALGTPVHFFSLEQTELETVEQGSFRALTRMTASQRDRAYAAALDAIRISDWLSEKLSGLPAPDFPDWSGEFESPATAASSLRSRWALGLDPIDNLLRQCELHGVRVFSLPTATREVDAFSLWHGRTPIVLVDTSKSAERQRFDLAHEVGHLVMHRNGSGSTGRDKEREADEFASCLLMPESEVRAFAPRQPSMHQLIESKARWRVSAKALSYRINALGMMTEWHYRQLCIEFAQNWKDREPEPSWHERSNLLAGAEGAWRSQGLRRADVASQLSMTTDDLGALLAGLTVGGVESEVDPDRYRASSDRATLRVVR